MLIHLEALYHQSLLHRSHTPYQAPPHKDTVEPLLWDTPIQGTLPFKFGQIQVGCTNVFKFRPYPPLEFQQLSGESVRTRTWRVVSSILTWSSENFLVFEFSFFFNVIKTCPYSGKRDTFFSIPKSRFNFYSGDTLALKRYLHATDHKKG